MAVKKAWQALEKGSPLAEFAPVKAGLGTNSCERVSESAGAGGTSHSASASCSAANLMIAALDCLESNPECPRISLSRQILPFLTKKIDTLRCTRSPHSQRPSLRISRETGYEKAHNVSVILFSPLPSCTAVSIHQRHTGFSDCDLYGRGFKIDYGRCKLCSQERVRGDVGR